MTNTPTPEALERARTACGCPWCRDREGAACAGALDWAPILDAHAAEATAEMRVHLDRKQSHQLALELACLTLTRERDEASAKLASGERDHLHALAQRDEFASVIVEAAVAAGCTEEWSSCHEHGDCIINGIGALEDQLIEALALVLDAHADVTAETLADAHVATARYQSQRREIEGLRKNGPTLRAQLAEQKREVVKGNMAFDRLTDKLAERDAELAALRALDGEGVPEEGCAVCDNTVHTDACPADCHCRVEPTP